MAGTNRPASSCQLSPYLLCIISVPREVFQNDANEEVEDEEVPYHHEKHKVEDMPPASFTLGLIAYATHVQALHPKGNKTVLG